MDTGAQRKAKNNIDSRIFTPTGTSNVSREEGAASAYLGKDRRSIFHPAPPSPSPLPITPQQSHNSLPPHITRTFAVTSTSTPTSTFPSTFTSTSTFESAFTSSTSSPLSTNAISPPRTQSSTSNPTSILSPPGKPGYIYFPSPLTTPPATPPIPDGFQIIQSSWLPSSAAIMASAAVCKDEPPGVIPAHVPHNISSPTQSKAFNKSMDRGTLCITHSAPDIVLQKGDVGYREHVSKYYHAHESEANEGLIRLKSKLRTLHDDSFWTAATEGLGALVGAQYAFISKRIDEDDAASGSPTPPLGEPGSCMLSMSVHFNDGKGLQFTSKQSRYFTYGSPCAYMKHNKVMLIPENLTLLTANNPNVLPAEPEAFLAVPLSYFPVGSDVPKVFGHFGIMWTAEGIAAKKMRFAHVETILHSLEDLLVFKFQEGGYLDQKPTATSTADSLVFQDQKPVAAQSFRPYARSLSHELRTPMQGVVGMLDLMYAAVQEASEGSIDMRIRNVFQMLKENIEEVHDSARRAVEAADNVVHAYDMNMSVPDAPAVTQEEEDIPIKAIEAALPENIEGAATPAQNHKRQRPSFDEAFDNIYKMPRLSSGQNSVAMESPHRERGSLESPVATSSSGTPYIENTPNSSHLSLERTIAPGVRHTVIGDTLQTIINDVLKIGGRPESAIAQPIDGGEEIEVRQRGQNGDEKVKTVRWTIDAAVPETILVDERDLAGLLSRVLHNAFKFTESGSISTTVRLSPKGKYILITVTDTGHGIPKAFMPNLFKAFSKEDDSLTRQSEGLGLGLMVAKGLARRLNGDLYAVRSEIDGPKKGTEFEMRIPLAPGESVSRPSTPYGSRSPSTASLSVDGEPASHPHHTPNSPRLQVKPSGPRHSRSGSLLSRNLAANSRLLNSSVDSALSKLGQATPSIMDISLGATSLVPITSTTTKRLSPPSHIQNRRNSYNRKSPSYRKADEKLAAVLPLAFLVVEDNSLLRKVLIQMLRNLGYTRIHEAYDGQDALRQMEEHRRKVLAGEANYEIDVVLMDLWMPNMNGYSAAEYIIRQSTKMAEKSTTDVKGGWKTPIIMAVTADVTDEAMDSVAKSGMKGPLTKPYKQIDLERTLVEICAMPPPTSTVAV